MGKRRKATPREKREITKKLEEILKNPKESGWNKYKALDFLAKIEMKKKLRKVV